MGNDKLIKFRNEQKMSIAEMADAIGVSKSYYEKIEYGNRNPSFNFIQKFMCRFPESDASKIFL